MMIRLFSFCVCVCVCDSLLFLTLFCMCLLMLSMLAKNQQTTFSNTFLILPRKQALTFHAFHEMSDPIYREK